MGFPRELWIGVCLFFPVVATVAADASRPNFIVIFTDDHGYADLASQKIFDDLATPHLDRLAAGGVLMRSGYVTAPQCVPSRAGLLTGRYQNRFGVESNGESLEGFNEQLTLAERLKGLGYATGMTGKWHLGPEAEITTHGFDDVYYKNSNGPGWANFNLDGSSREPGPENSQLYHLDANSAAACAFIRRHQAEPFFFYCAYRAPHVPLDAPAKYLQRFPGEMPERRRQALAMLSAVDDGVGSIVNTLQECHLEENTLLFFIGDNGAPLKIHKLDEPGGGPGWDGSLNDPLNGEKGMLSEGGVRVPFIVSWKGKIPGGQIFDPPVISLDVAATALALAPAGSSPTASSPQTQNAGQVPSLDGVNLIPYLTGSNPGQPHEALFWRWIAQSAVREGKWKYLRGGTREYLFDLENDLAEKRNLIEAEPDVARRLRGKLTSWCAELQPPGLETQRMSETWENYYDYYLDGQPAPKQPTARAQSSTPRSDAGPAATRVGGWLARGASLRQQSGFLQVLPFEKAKPFITTSGLRLPSQVSIQLRLRSDADGLLRVAWRQASDRDFRDDHVVETPIARQDHFSDYSLRIDAEEPVIHLRVIVPAARVDVESIVAQDSAGNIAMEWQFSQSAN